MLMIYLEREYSFCMLREDPMLHCELCVPLSAGIRMPP